MTGSTRVTRDLLACGVIAGPLYVTVSLLQAFTRAGFDPVQHPWSLLANGGLGWIQIANLVLAGLLTLAAAAGLRRALAAGRAATWAPRLFAGYGLSLVIAGIFRADPAPGFPPETGENAVEISWQGAVHLSAGAVGFVCLATACLVLASRFAADRRPGWAGWSRIAALALLGGFAWIALSGGSSAANLGFTAAIVITWVWVTAVTWHFHRRAVAMPVPALRH